MAGLLGKPTKEGASRALSSGRPTEAAEAFSDANDLRENAIQTNNLGPATSSMGAHAAAHGDFALHCEDRQDMDRAISHCERALTLDAGYAPARMNLIRMLCDAGRYRDSLPHLEAVAEQGAEVVVAAVAERPRPFNA